MSPRDSNESTVQAPRRFRRPWARSQRPIPRKVVQPLERFLGDEAGSGGLLLAAALVALVWINVAGDSYDELWSHRITIELGSLHFDEDLRHIVNDLLMAVFFFVVALEVKREALFGSLREPVSAAVPIAAALGTMVGGAVAYLAINIGGGNLDGWAVPIATDIAFALSVLGVAGRRAPPALRAFMLTLAVVDDLATIAIIAVVFTSDLSLVWLAGAAMVVLGIVVLQRLGVRFMPVYVVAAGLLWIAVFESGVHATIAGVVLGFLTPAVAFYRTEPTGEAIASQLKQISDRADVEIEEATMWEASRLSREAVSPLHRMEEQLHPWSAYLILPLFALANAGVEISLSDLGDAVTSQVGLGIIIGLAIAAPLGGVLFSRAVVRLTPARLQSDLDWPAIYALAPLKGIGFTVAIFICLLAFDSTEAQDQAKLAILVGSALAAAIGTAGFWLRARSEREGAG
jgi:NhaA family Na+:H+ antiporter